MAVPKRRFDVDAILANLKSRKPKSPLEHWLDADEERAADFWESIQRAKGMGFGIAAALEAWNVTYPENACPVKQNQVRLKLREMEGTASAPR